MGVLGTLFQDTSVAILMLGTLAVVIAIPTFITLYIRRMTKS